MSKAAKNMGLIALYIPLATGAFALGGYITSVLWGWFLAEPFGVFQISTLQAMGIGCVVRCFSWSNARSFELYDPDKPKRGHWERSFEGLFHAYLIPLLLLFIGWVIRQVG